MPSELINHQFEHGDNPTILQFDPSQLPEKKRGSYPKLSLVTRFQYTGERGVGGERKNTYWVYMVVTDTQTGDSVWEGKSNSVEIYSKRGSVGM